MFYLITDSIFDFIAKDYVERFDLAWSCSLLLALFAKKLYNINETLEKILEKND